MLQDISPIPKLCTYTYTHVQPPTHTQETSNFKRFQHYLKKNSYELFKEELNK